MMERVPIVSTEQVARYFRTYGSPATRASEYLKALEREGLVEGYNRELGKSKCWRLTAKGRKDRKIEGKAHPFSTNKIEHILALGDAYQALEPFLVEWKVEPRYQIEEGLTVAPDAFMIVRKADGKRYLFLLEIQLSPLSSQRWASKWENRRRLYENKRYTEFFPVPPAMLLLCRQPKETVLIGAEGLPILRFTETVYLSKIFV